MAIRRVNIYCDKDLVLRYVETMPEEPGLFCKDDIEKMILSQKYYSALQSVKDSSIPFEDQETAWEVIGNIIDPYNKPFKRDTFYTIELNGEVEITYKYTDDGEYVSYSDDGEARSTKVARLKPELNSISEKPIKEMVEEITLKFTEWTGNIRNAPIITENKVKSEEKEEKSESQEDILQAFFDEVCDQGENLSYTELLKKFQITRKGNTL